MKENYCPTYDIFKILTFTFDGVLPDGRQAGATVDMVGRLNPFRIRSKAKSLFNSL